MNKGSKVPSRKEKAIKSFLTEYYVPKSTIRDALGSSTETATQIFEEAKRIEKERCSIDPRPHQAQVQTVLKITKINYSFMKKQYEMLQQLKQEEL
ncbi:hypothetical protein ERUR111494_02430 [Erysipelothrix urinaevulpis]|uniref:hypothetical protein n=1 Tax=Erysipelothrix urinaevulpis TaxID=2683717 RepID=UPI00135B60ED|nr:hypothetical protein [Erysipelothrix urinaevulpis]